MRSWIRCRLVKGWGEHALQLPRSPLRYTGFVVRTQAGWTVELRTKGDTVEAVFFHPSGERVGAYANARRMALQTAKSTA